MIDHEDAFHHEHSVIGKGLIVGIVLGALLWAAIIGGVVYMW